MASFSSITRCSGCKRKALLAMHFRKFKRPTEPLQFGKAYHKAMEEGISSGIDDLKEYGMEDKKELLIDMYARIQKFMLDNEIKILEHEVEFDIEFDEFKEHFVGFIDAVVEWKGEIWLAEFKTARSISVEHVPIDSQITSYLWACDYTGEYKPKGVLYMVNKKSRTKDPIILKSGYLSVSKTQGCSYERYKYEAERMYGPIINMSEKTFESIKKYAHLNEEDEVYFISYPDTDDITHDENFKKFDSEKVVDAYIKRIVKVKAFIEWLKENESPQFVCVATFRTREELNSFETMLFQNIAKQESLTDKYNKDGIVKALQTTTCFPHKMCFDTCDYKEECLYLMQHKDVEDEDLDESFYDRGGDESID